MSEQRQDPFNGEPITVADDGTIPTWIVTWTGQEAPGRKRYLSRPRHERLVRLRSQYGHPYQEVQEKHPKGFISNRSSCFIHKDEAESEYNWIKGILVKRGDWEEQQAHLTLTDGERASWYDLFGEPGIYGWMA